MRTPFLYKWLTPKVIVYNAKIIKTATVENAIPISPKILKKV